MLVFGVVVSALWLFGLGFVVYLNLDKALSLELNALGDFLAGGFAPLAFLWLVIGYFQQGRELKLSREALILQANELSNSVEQQKRLVAATREEIELVKISEKRKYESDKFKAQPIVYMFDYKYIPSVSGGNYKVYLKNTGHSILHVKLALVCGPDYMTMSSEKYWDRWDFDKDKVIGFSLDTIIKLKEGDEFEVLIEYKDGLMEQSSKTLFFSSLGVRGLKLATEKEIAT